MIRALLLSTLVAGGKPCRPEALFQPPGGTGDGTSLHPLGSVLWL